MRPGAGGRGYQRARPCPQCGGWQFTVNRCQHCGLEDLDYARSHSSAGRLFERVLELEFDAAHFAIPWSDVTAEEVRGLQILKEERDRYQREQAQKPDPVTARQAQQSIKNGPTPPCEPSADLPVADGTRSAGSAFYALEAASTAIVIEHPQADPSLSPRGQPFHLVIVGFQNIADEDRCGAGREAAIDASRTASA